MLGQIDMTDDLHLGRLERVVYAQRDLGLGACGELYGLGGRGGSISLSLDESCGLLGALHRGGVNGACASLWGLVGATLDLTIALLALTLVDKETIDDGVATEGAAIDQLIHHHGVSRFLEELVGRVGRRVVSAAVTFVLEIPAEDHHTGAEGVELAYQGDIVSIGSDEYDDVKLILQCTLVSLQSEEHIDALLLLLIALARAREGQVMHHHTLRIQYIVKEALIEEHIARSLRGLGC